MRVTTDLPSMLAQWLKCFIWNEEDPCSSLGRDTGRPRFSSVPCSDFIIIIIDYNDYMVWVLLVRSGSQIWSDHFFIGLARLLYPCAWYCRMYFDIPYCSILCKCCSQLLYFYIYLKALYYFPVPCML